MYKQSLKLHYDNMTKTQKFSSKILIVFTILFVFGLVGPLANAFSQGSKASANVPLLDLDFQTHLIVFTIIWPIFLSIILVILFPLIFVPIFLFVKRKLLKKYKDGYLDIDETKFDSKKFLKRLIYLLLLTLGVNAAILGLELFNPEVLLPGEIYADTPAKIEAFLAQPLFYVDVFVGFASLIFPLIVGLWSIGWALEDTGLMHFKLPKKGDKALYEIEPIYLKYNAVIKGYAGISAILYLISAIIFYISIDDMVIMLQMLSSMVSMLFLVIPAYVIYTIFAEKIFKGLFRKNIESVPLITEETYLDK